MNIYLFINRGKFFLLILLKKFINQYLVYETLVLLIMNTEYSFLIHSIKTKNRIRDSESEIDFFYRLLEKF